jgi:hypothetical protein
MYEHFRVPSSENREGWGNLSYIGHLENWRGKMGQPSRAI